MLTNILFQIKRWYMITFKKGVNISINLSDDAINFIFDISLQTGKSADQIIIEAIKEYTNEKRK